MPEDHSPSDRVLDSVPDLLASLLSASPDDPEVRRLAFDWIRRNAGGEAVNLLAPLISAAPDDAEIRHFALDWLHRYLGSEAARYVLVPLISAAPGDPEIRHLGLDWEIARLEAGAPTAREIEIQR